MTRDSDSITPDTIDRFETGAEAFAYLRLVGTKDDGEIDVGEVALALALVNLPGINVTRYRHHLAKLVEHARDDYSSRKRTGEDTLAMQADVLRHVIHEAHGYHGDAQTYDDLDNANLIRVIDRRKGLPVALGIIYIVVGRALGFAIDGLSFPGHFILRLERDGQRLILDPFRDGAELDAAALRQLVKKMIGEQAELSHKYYTAVGNRDLLLRLQNNLKTRLIENEDYHQALQVIETMAAIAPDEVRTLFDKAVLYAKLGQIRQAAAALEEYIARIPDAREKQQARLLLQQILQMQDR